MKSLIYILVLLFTTILSAEIKVEDSIVKIYTVSKTPNYTMQYHGIRR